MSICLKAPNAMQVLKKVLRSDVHTYNTCTHYNRSNNGVVFLWAKLVRFLAQPIDVLQTYNQISMGRVLDEFHRPGLTI